MSEDRIKRRRFIADVLFAGGGLAAAALLASNCVRRPPEPAVSDQPAPVPDPKGSPSRAPVAPEPPGSGDSDPLPDRPVQAPQTRDPFNDPFVPRPTGTPAAPPEPHTAGRPAAPPPDPAPTARFPGQMTVPVTPGEP